VGCVRKRIVSWFLVLGLTLTGSQMLAAKEQPKIPYPPVNYGTGPQSDVIKRGEYLTKVADCIACHTDTDHNGKPFAGGLAINTPFGTFFSANITPDKETGIGNWTDAQFIRALHEGIRPDGKYYFPVFPYTSFTKVSDQDLLAIKAYLAAIPAVHAPNKETTARWPFSWRFSQLGWRMLFFRKGYFQDDSSKNALWNRGAYYVQGLAHCGECHTPRNFMGGSKNTYYLTGGLVDHYTAPDITKVGLKGVSLDQVEDILAKDELPGGTQVTGPMAEVIHNSMVYLAPKDILAIAYYLKSLQSKEPRGRKSGKTAIDVSKYDVKQGQSIFETHCAACHTTGAAGAPKIGVAAAWMQRFAEGFPTLLKHVEEGYNAMPAKGMCTSCTRNSESTQVTPPAAPVPTGKEIYEQHCSSCHAPDADTDEDAPEIKDKKAWKEILNQGMLNLFERTIETHETKHQIKNLNVTGSELEAAIVYMATQSSDQDYSLWCK
jgi:cytochrome c5